MLCSFITEIYIAPLRNYHSCQPFRFCRNSSAFYTIFRHSDRNGQIPPKLKKFGNANTILRACASQAKYISMFCVMLLPAYTYF